MSATQTLTPPAELARSKTESVEGFLSAIAVEPATLSVESSGTFTFDNARKRALRAQNVGSDVQTIPEESTAPRGSPQNPPVLAQMRIAGMQRAHIPNEELAKYGVSKETKSDANDLNGIQRQWKPNNSTSMLDSNNRTTETDADRKGERPAREGEEVRQRRVEMEMESEERKQEKEARRLEKEEREKEREELARERAQRQVEFQERQKEREERIKEREEREKEKIQRLAEMEERRVEREERLREVEELREERKQRQIEVNERAREREERSEEHQERIRELTLRRLEIKVHEEMMEERRKEREEREKERLERQKEIAEMAQYRKEIDIILQEHKSLEKVGNIDKSNDDGVRRIRELEITNASLTNELEKVKEELRIIKREMEADQKKVASLMDYMALYQMPNDKVADFNRLKNLVVCAQQKIAKASDLELASWLTTLGTSQVTEIRYETAQALLKERNLDIVTRNFLRHKSAVIYIVELESRIGLQRDQNYTAFGKFPREVYVTAWKRLLPQNGEVGMDHTIFDALVDFVCAGER